MDILRTKRAAVMAVTVSALLISLAMASVSAGARPLAMARLPQGLVMKWNHPRFGGLPDATLGGPAIRIGSLKGPHGLSIGADERLIVIDAEPRVQSFAPTGEVLSSLSVEGAVDAVTTANGVIVVLTNGTLSACGPTGLSLWTTDAPRSAVAGA